MLPSEIVRDNKGAEVCHRVREIAVPNVKNDPSKGHKYVKAYCGQPVVFSVEEKQKICPECDKQPPVGNVHPRMTNSAGTILTAAELKECGLTEDPSLKPSKTSKTRKPREAKKAVEAKVSKVKKDSVSIDIDLSTLESADDIAAVLIRKASDALNLLPITNFAESKRLIRLQEKLDAMLKV